MERRQTRPALRPAAHPDAAALQALCATDNDLDTLLLPQWQVDDWSALLRGARDQHLASGEVLMQVGGSDRAVYLLVSGGLDVRAGTSGAFGSITRLKPGAVVGEIAFFDGGARSATVWANQPSRLLVLDDAVVQAFVAAHAARGPELLMALAQVVARRVRRSEDRRLSETL